MGFVPHFALYSLGVLCPLSPSAVDAKSRSHSLSRDSSRHGDSDTVSSTRRTARVLKSPGCHPEPDCGHQNGTLVMPLGPHRRAFLACLIAEVELALAARAGPSAILSMNGLSLTAFGVSALKTAPLGICRRLHLPQSEPSGPWDLSILLARWASSRAPA